MRRHLLVGCATLILAVFTMGSPRASACDDECGDGYGHGYYARPAYTYYYAPPVYYAPRAYAYYAPPVYYARPAYRHYSPYYYGRPAYYAPRAYYGDYHRHHRHW